MEQFINKLKNALLLPLPGEEVQYQMAPLNRQRIAVQRLKVSEFKPSAVMLLFCMDELGEHFIPLTQRLDYNGAHSGQISLPGGKFDSLDANLQHTALRECDEEIGINRVEVLGKLTPLFIPLSGFLVHPFVGFCDVKNPPMPYQKREVRSIIKLTKTDLLNDSIIKQGTLDFINKMKIKTPYFEVNEQRVWGATAMMLNELKEIIKTIS